MVCAWTDRPSRWVYHVFSPLHELLVDHLASIIRSGLDMDCLLNDGVRAATKRLSGPVLCKGHRD